MTAAAATAESPQPARRRVSDAERELTSLGQYVDLSQAARQKGYDLEAIIDFLERGVDRYSNAVDALALLGQYNSYATALQGARPEQRLKFTNLANEYFERALALDHRDPNALVPYGIFARETGQFPKAETLYAQIMRVEGVKPINLVYLARVYGAWRPEDLRYLAMACLKKAVDMRPDYDRAREELAKYDGLKITPAKWMDLRSYLLELAEKAFPEKQTLLVRAPHAPARIVPTPSQTRSTPDAPWRLETAKPKPGMPAPRPAIIVKKNTQPANGKKGTALTPFIPSTMFSGVTQVDMPVKPLLPKAVNPAPFRSLEERSLLAHISNLYAQCARDRDNPFFHLELALAFKEAAERANDPNLRGFAWNHLRAGYRLERASPLAKNVLRAFHDWHPAANRQVAQIMSSVPAPSYGVA